VPTVDTAVSNKTFAAMHAAIHSGAVAACHDLSEGGLATAAAEMAFAGGMGMQLSLDGINVSEGGVSAKLFSESNTRFLVEVKKDQAAQFEKAMAGVTLAKLGTVEFGPRLTIQSAGSVVVDADILELKAAWQKPLAW
jgi:phosphoribosylformylglycinamidine synthase